MNIYMFLMMVIVWIDNFLTYICFDNNGISGIYEFEYFRYMCIIQQLKKHLTLLFVYLYIDKNLEGRLFLENII